MEGIVRRGDEEDRFLANYLLLPPRERVRVWKEGRNAGGIKQSSMDDALIARGVDAVPYLAEVVRRGDSYHRVYALKILCDMDRFMPADELPLPELAGSIYVKALNLKGRLDPFMVVDGRRIGREGYEAVKWAAEQTENNDLRLHAREFSGLFEQELRQLSLEELVTRWRQSVVKSKGILGADIDAYNRLRSTEAILIEEAPESIPPLLALLDNDSDAYVREEAVTVLAMIDTYRMRLRSKLVGREAIESIHRALERGNLKPVFTAREAREKAWRELSARFFNDEVEIHHGSWWAVIALAFEKFYGVKATEQYNTTPEIHLIEAAPEMRQFVAYLTEVDPFFPSWEYTYVGPAADGTLHARFREKVARYYEHWKRFKAAGDDAHATDRRGSGAARELTTKPTLLANPD